MTKQSTSKLISLILINEIRTVLYFPVWWYTKGLVKMLIGSWHFVQDFNLTLGFTIWLKNIFVPMFGQRDIAGRLISVFLRIVNIIFRGIAMLFLIALTFIFIIIWLVLPIFILFQIIIYIA